MKWYSEEIKSQYELINKMVSYALGQKYPGTYFKLGEESYNELFNPDRNKYQLPTVDIILCVDFGINYKLDYSNIGVDTIKFITNAFTTIVTDSDVLSYYGRSYNSDGTFYMNKFYINKTKHCRGRVPYTVE